MKGFEWLKHIFRVADKTYSPAERHERKRRRRRRPLRRGTRCAICKAFVPYSEATVIARDRERHHVCIEHGKPVSGPSEKAVARSKKRKLRTEN